MAGFRPFGLLSDYDREDPRNAMSYGGGGATGRTPDAFDVFGRVGYGFTGVGGVQDAAGLLGGPSLRENLSQGNNFDAALQAAGVLPVVGGAAKAGLLGVSKLAATVPGLLAGGKMVAKGLNVADDLARPAAEAVTPGITAYHGSPHSFDRFDLSKIGTGEGAQAYGHGLYFADSENVAKSYRDANQKFETFINGERLTPDNPNFSAGMHIAAHGYDKALNEFENYVASGFVKPELLEQMRALKGAKIEQKPGGSMYQVRINADPEHFLDWDKPLSEHPPAVQEALKRRYGAYYEKVFRPSSTGEDVAARIEGPEAAGEMARAGIPGIKYLDQGSRGAGEGSRNYVVFDDKIVEILKKYGLVGLLGGGAAMGASGQSQPSQQGAPFL